MKLAVALVLLATACTSASPGATTSTSSRARLAAAVRVLPDPTLTPGATDPQVTQANITTTICVAGWSTKQRPSLYVGLKLKKQAMAAYHYTDYHSFEGDHLIALSLAGAPLDLRNYWPEPWSTKGAKLAPRGKGAEAKDQVENALRRRVCKGTMTLTEAQQRIATDWTTALK